MDSFMDKLAHKLTAQEMIKANSAAEAEAAERLRSEVKAYKECLDRMMSIGVTLEEEVGKVVESGLAKIEDTQVQPTDLSDITDEIRSLKLLMEKLEKNMEEQKAQETEEDSKVPATEEYVHKECVKVYRNVQAVVSDVSKMNEELNEEIHHSLKGKLIAVIIINILAFLASAGAIAVSLLGITL